MSRRGNRKWSRRRLNKIVVDDTFSKPAGLDNQIQFNNNGAFGAVSALTFDDTHLRLIDNSKFNFGSDDDAFIQYDESGNDYLIISGSSKGIVLSGSTVEVAGTLTGASLEGVSIAGGIDITSNAGGDPTNMKFADDIKLVFGSDDDAFIEYNENGDDYLVISGSSQGIVLSGSTIQIRGVLQGASPLRIAGGIEIEPASDGDETQMSFKDDIKLYFGTDLDSYIAYHDNGTSCLEISGSGNGILLSGSAVYVDEKIGVNIPVGSATHAITLPDNADNTGKIKANAYMTYSSARFKQDVEVIDNPIQTIQNLRGVTFTWKKNSQKDYGFIAEEVGKELPIIVEWDNNNSKEETPQALSMDYTRIIPILLEGIKSQQNQIDDLKDEIKSLKQGTELS